MFMYKFRLYDIFLLFINLISSYVCSSFNLFVWLMSQDGIFSAIDFIKNNSNDELSESQVITKNTNLYMTGTFERSIFYACLHILYYFTTIFVLNTDVVFMKYIIGLVTVPYIFNHIIYPNVRDYFTKLTNEKNEVLKNICFEQIANIIIKLEKTYLESDISIQKSEIICALENIDNIREESGTLIRNFLITSLLIYLRKNSKLYYKIAKYIYVYGYKEFIQDMTIDKAKYLFKDVIENKKYDQIAKPMFIQSVIYLYYSKEDTGTFKNIIKKFNYRIMVMFSLWTFGSFFTGYVIPLVIITMSLAITFTRKLPMTENILMPVLDSCDLSSSKKLNFVKEKITKLSQNKYFDDRTFISMLITIIFSFLTINPFILSFLNQFSGILLLNNTTYNFAKIIYIKFNKNVSTIFSTLVSNRIISLKYISVAITFIFSVNISSYFSFLIPIGTNFIVIDSASYKYLYILLYIGMMNNKNNPLKIIIFAYILSLVDKIIGKIIVNVENIIKQKKTDVPPKTDYIHPTSNMAKKRKNIKVKLQNYQARQPDDQMIESIILF